MKDLLAFSLMTYTLQQIWLEYEHTKDEERFVGRIRLHIPA